MKFLRTASTGRLLAVIAGVVVAIAAGTAIAVAATGSGPVPKREPSRAGAPRGALTAKPVHGHLGRHHLHQPPDRLHRLPGRPPTRCCRAPRAACGCPMTAACGSSSSPTTATPRSSSTRARSGSPTRRRTPSTRARCRPTGRQAADQGARPRADHGIPTVAEIQSRHQQAGQRTSTSSGAIRPGDVAGQPAYTVRSRPSTTAACSARSQLAWDAVTGVPLRIAIYARGNSDAGAGAQGHQHLLRAGRRLRLHHHARRPVKVVKIASPGRPHARRRPAPSWPGPANAHHAGGPAASPRSPGTCRSRWPRPARWSALPRQGVTLLDWGGKPAALVTYGQSLGGDRGDRAERRRRGRDGAELELRAAAGRPQPADGLDQRRHRPGARHGARHGGALHPRRRRLHGARLGARSGRAGGRALTP